MKFISAAPLAQRHPSSAHSSKHLFLRAALCAYLLSAPALAHAFPTGHTLPARLATEVVATVCALPEARVYRAYALGIGAILLQAALIGLLLLERRRRQTAERNANLRLIELAQQHRAASLGEMSAAIAHELGQPLAAMLSNAEAARLMLERQPPQVADARQALLDITRDHERATRVIRRITALYRGVDLEASEIDLNVLIKDVVRMLAQDAAHRRVDVALDLDASIPTVSGDYVQLQQVVLNLLRNAMDAIPANADFRRVHLSTERQDQHVRVAVSDSGVGIPDQAQAHIFEPFYTTKDQGVGMGLAVSRRIVEAHNGRLNVSHSRLGGAQLALELPIAEAI